MSGEFFRLYKDLERTSLRTKTKVDVGYERERLNTLRCLGYNIAGGKSTAPHPWHGRIARRNAEERKLKPVPDYKEANERRQAFVDIIKQSERIKKESGAFMKKVSAADAHKFKKFEKRQPVRPPDSIAREITITRKTYSEKIWSHDEQDRLKSLYLQLNKPPTTGPRGCADMWEMYLHQFVTHFRYFHPERSYTDVAEKVKELVQKRQLKENGEKIYWELILSSSNAKDEGVTVDHSTAS
jgi:hypothetical protein